MKKYIIMRLLYGVYFFLDWGEKATKIFWRFSCNKNSGLKFQTFCVSNGGNDTFRLHDLTQATVRLIHAKNYQKNGKRDSGTKSTIPKFWIQFAQTVNQRVCPCK